MQIPDWAVAATVTAAVVMALLVLWSWRRAARLSRRLRELDHAKRSLSTRYGQITEQFAPFVADWPWDPKHFRFLGSPVDGVQFNDDGVVFVEVKANGSRLSDEQRRVREHVEAGRVAWREVRIG